MKRKYCLYMLAILCVSWLGVADAASYAVEATYSHNGLPIPNIEDKTSTTLSVEAIHSKGQCLSKLNEQAIQHYALGQALSVGATDLMLKCVKVWRRADCESYNISCYGHAGIGKAKFFKTYSDGVTIPQYLRLSPHRNYEVLRTIGFTAEKGKDGKPDIAFAVQVEYKKKVFKKLTGKSLHCNKAIVDNGLHSMFKKLFFKDSKAGGICSHVSPSTALGKSQRASMRF